ncbi:MAG: hypothetical protein MP439_01890 [Ferrimicrobium sp.]|jgi:hypothetical protein|nr:hypothetical protein [Ferrimicrobium sp.]
MRTAGGFDPATHQTAVDEMVASSVIADNIVGQTTHPPSYKMMLVGSWRAAGVGPMLLVVSRS